MGKGGYQLARKVKVDDPLADPQNNVNPQTHPSPTNTVTNKNRLHNAIAPQHWLMIRSQRLRVQKQRHSYKPSLFVILRNP